MNNKNSISLLSELNKQEQYYVVFFIQEKKYAVSIQNVAEIINIPKIEIPETTPIGIIGIFNYNGIPIKAVDLCPFLGFKTSSFTINNRMIILKSKDKHFAVNTDCIDTIKALDSNFIFPLPFSSENSILNKIYNSNNENINIIDCDALNKLISKDNLKRNEVNYELLFPTDEKSKRILESRIKNYLEPQQVFSFPINLHSEKKYILFSMSNQNYYIDIKYAKEFISMNHIHLTKLPYTPEYITGLVSVKGEFFVVFNLEKFINKTCENNKNTTEGKLIIIENKNFNIAFLVDDIKYIKSLNEIKNSKLYSSNSDFIYAEFMENNELYSILNFDKILSDERLYINIE